MITTNLDESSPTGLTKARPTISLPAMPCEVRFRGGQKLKPSFLEGSPAPTFNLQAKTEAEFIEQPFEAWEILSRRLLDSFLAVSTPNEALHFLASTGHFLWDAWSWQHAHHSDELSWAEFQQWQDLIRDIIASGFLVAIRDSKAEGGISTIDDFPAPRLDSDRKRLILNVPDETFELLNGSAPAFSLETRFDPADPNGPPQFALVTEMLTSIDAMLARLYIEAITTN